MHACLDRDRPVLSYWSWSFELPYLESPVQVQWLSLKFLRERTTLGSSTIPQMFAIAHSQQSKTAETLCVIPESGGNLASRGRMRTTCDKFVNGWRRRSVDSF